MVRHGDVVFQLREMYNKRVPFRQLPIYTKESNEHSEWYKIREHIDPNADCWSTSGLPRPHGVEFIPVDVAYRLGVFLI